jgi:hypothetical protein
MNPFKRLFEWRKNHAVRALLRCSRVKREKLKATAKEVELLAALHHCAAIKAITPPSPDLSVIAMIARESGTVSPPKLARALQVSYITAEAALEVLAEMHFLELLPERGIVPVYRLTRAAYVKLEADRQSRPCIQASLGL